MQWAEELIVGGVTKNNNTLTRLVTIDRFKKISLSESLERIPVIGKICKPKLKWFNFVVSVTRKKIKGILIKWSTSKPT